MSANAFINLPIRRVCRVDSGDNSIKDDRYYQVFEIQKDGTWKAVSKGYRHSTSAFAALGRLTQKDVVKELNKYAIQ